MATGILGAVAIKICRLTGIEIPIIKKIQSHDRLIFIIEITIPEKIFFISRRGPDFTRT